MTADPRTALRALAAPLITLAVLIGGLALKAGPFAVWADRWFLIGLILLGLPVVARTVLGALRGHLAADLVASLSIVTAVLLNQPIPGLVVVLMQTGGEALERFAAGRASRAVAALEAAAPRQAHRLRPDGVDDIPADEVTIGERVLIRPGEMVPCDGRVDEGSSHLDVSRLTGEPIPLAAGPGAALLSGSLNLESPLTLVVTALAGDSQYARIVQLVRSAQASKSPLQRLADRYAVYFTPVTLGVCLVTWLLTHDPLRLLAVLVVATPCPLILAAPVAMIGGINRAARQGIIIRHGEALERLGEATVALLDKTGTLTVGRPSVAAVRAVTPFTSDEVLGLAAAVDAGSGHLLARSVVAAAADRGLVLAGTSEVVESAGRGVTGRVGAREVTLGARPFVLEQHPGLAGRWPDGGAALRSWIAVDGQPAGTIEFADQLRPEGAALVRQLTALGFRRIVMVTGDHAAHARAIALEAGITDVRAELLPSGKVDIVRELEETGERVLMVGDGTNDAPALTRASVGVALTAHGGGITAEAADVVVLADDPTLVATAVQISRRTLRIARESVWVGLGLSGVAMLVAAAGAIPPTFGAMLQEVIDVAVILNALRASADLPAAART